MSNGNQAVSSSLKAGKTKTMKPRSALEDWKQHHPNHLPTRYQSYGPAGNLIRLPAETTAITAAPVTTNPRANGHVPSCFFDATNPALIKALGTV